MKYVVIAALALIAGLILMIVLRRVRAAQVHNPPTTIPSGVAATNAPPSNAWRGLRDMVLNLKPAEFGIAPADADPFGFVMEMGYTTRDTKVTVVALRDGTMSLYLSSGGGTLGTGQRSPQAAQLAKDVVAFTREYVGRMSKTTIFPVPATGRVRFFVLTGQGVFTVETDLAAVEQRDDTWFPLFNARQSVITQIRLVSEAAPGKTPR